MDLRATSPSHPNGAARACLCALWLAWGAQQAPAARQEAVQAIISRDRTNTVVIGQCKGQAIVAGSDARLRKPLQDDVPYTTQAMSQDLLRVQKRLGRMPVPSRTRCNLFLSDSRFRSRGVVGGRQLCPRASSKGATIAEYLAVRSRRAVCRNYPLHLGSQQGR